ncbi:MAG: FtsX-like permease family protein, partial [Coriobacteriaceae bacterium]|nr:FtsX-like permease family protein [Coriobacteriaceae bacterium]
MLSAFAKETLRSITRSPGRFIAIAAIVALGCGFYAGLQMSGPDMDRSADDYFDDTALMDLRVVSTLGVTDEDLEALGEVDGVEEVMGGYEADVMMDAEGEDFVTRVHSLSPSALTSDTSDGLHAYSDDAAYLNRPILKEGAWPSAPDECVVGYEVVGAEDLHVGETVTFIEGVTELDDTFVTTTFTVVGLVDSSYYASTTTLGSSSLGTGSVKEYLYVLPEAFCEDLPYSEAFLTVAGAAEELYTSAAYDETVGVVQDRIDAIADERTQLRTDEIVGDAQGELDDKQAEYDRKKAKADRKLADAQAELDDAEAELADGEAELAEAQSDYDSGVAELEEQRVAAADEIAAAQAELDSSEQKLEKQRPRIEKLKKQLPSQQKKLKKSSKKLKKQEKKWQKSYDEVQAGITQAKAAVAAGVPGASATLAQLRATKKELKATYNEQIVPAQAEIEEGRSQIKQAKAAIKEFEDGEAELASGKAELESQRAEADAQLAAGQDELDEAAAQIAASQDELASGQADYEEGLAEYETQKAKADRRLDKARHRLSDAQAEIDDIEDAEWLVLDRSTNYGVEGHKSDAERIESIAQVFPFIFFLVAALVALTTMTRMVEEERELIGTFKALGYRRSRITSKYLIYAAIASGVGGVVGIAVLTQVLPFVIMYAYDVIYSIPISTPPLWLNPGITILSLALGIGVTLLATWGAAVATLRERASTLMLPRAPKAGKRIALEHIGPLWRHLSFSWKVTCRNLFRYKRRLFMTLIGIAGCAALLLTGLGLSDSINDIVDKQYDELMNYNAVINLDDDVAEAVGGEGSDAAAAEDWKAIEESLSGDDVADYAVVDWSNILASAPDKPEEDYDVEFVVVDDTADFAGFFDMHTRQGGQPVTLTDDNLVISEKMANELGLRVGDEVVLTEEDATGNATSTQYTATIGGIFENYVNHYIFMGSGLYRQLSGSEPVYGTVLAQVSATGEERTAFDEHLQSLPGIKTLSYNEDTADTYRTMLSSVDLVVVVLIIAAAVLAFVVIYNLTNINIIERLREIATLKVLGFRPGEIDSYIFRETLILALIGCLLGLLLGIWLEGFVVTSAEVDLVMFGRQIHVLSFVLAFVLTMVFAVIVLFAMRPKLRHVDMV